MSLKVEPVTSQDFETMSTYKFHQGGDLIAPLVPRFWPTSADDEPNGARNRWSLRQQRAFFNEDPTVRFMKCVDTSNGEIISLARWHYYENGYKHPEFTALELNGTAPDAEQTWPGAANGALAKAIIVPILEDRPRWSGDSPQWGKSSGGALFAGDSFTLVDHRCLLTKVLVLTTLKTRESQRERGAGGMLVRWGVEQAKKDNVPAFLEAAPTRAPLYEKCGFRRVGELALHLQEYGYSEPVVLTRMVANMNE